MSSHRGQSSHSEGGSRSHSNRDRERGSESESGSRGRTRIDRAKEKDREREREKDRERDSKRESERVRERETANKTAANSANNSSRRKRDDASLTHTPHSSDKKSDKPTAADEDIHVSIEDPTIRDIAHNDEASTVSGNSPVKGSKGLKKKKSFWQSLLHSRSAAADEGEEGVEREGLSPEEQDEDNDHTLTDSASQHTRNTQETTEGGAQTARRRIHFKKAKALKRTASRSYLKPVQEMAAGKFSNWTKAELIELIVGKHHIELRNEERMQVESLRDFVESLYEDQPAPPKPPQPGIFEVVMQNVMARRIQNSWIVYQASKRFRDEERALSATPVDDPLSAQDPLTEAELLYLANTHHSHNPSGRPLSMASHNSSSHGSIVDESTHRDAHTDTEREGRTDDEISGSTPNGSSLKAAKRASQRQKKTKKAMNILDLPWSPPDLGKAQKYADYVQPRRGGKGGELFEFCGTTTGRHCTLGGCGEQFDLWEEGQISEFGIYGPGVTNYFKFMKWAAWVFVVLTIISLPALVLNVNGTSTQDNDGLQAIARTTLGNLAPSLANATLSLRIPGCVDYGLYPVDCTFDGASLSQFYSSLDIVVSAVLFAGFIWLTLFEKVEEKELDESTVRASMFSLSVTNLPHDVTEAELVSHFNTLCGGGERVVAVSIAYDNVEEITECKKRGDLIREKVHLVHEHRFKCTELRKNKPDRADLLEKERDKFYERMKKLNTQLKEKEEKLERLSKLPAHAIYAFITFNRVSDRLTALTHYSEMSLYTYFCKNQHLRLKNRLLRVTPAPEPSIILWENLAVSYWSRIGRRLFTTLCSLLLVVISLVMIFSSKYLETKTSLNGVTDDSVTAGTTLCPAGYDTWTEEDQQAYVEANPAYMYCYCNQFSTIEQATNEVCSGYLQERVKAQVLLYFASFVVLIVNNLIVKAMQISSDFEKHHTQNGQGMSIFYRLFVLKYINTAAVFFINNNNVILKNVFGVTVESESEFTANWFNTIGVTIVLVQLGDVFNANSERLLEYFFFIYRKRRATKNLSLSLTQDDLNKVFVGPNFEFAFNYAQMMSTFFVCLTFSTGIPLLYPIAAANFALFYAVEKFMFIHCYKVPPHFNTLVGKKATQLIPLAILIHVVMSVWVLSNNSLFTSDNTIYADTNTQTTQAAEATVNPTVFGSVVRDKISTEAAFPLFLVFVAVLGFRVLMMIVKKMASWGKTSYHFVCGCLHSSDKKKDKKAHKVVTAAQVVTYTRAMQRNLIKGLGTYNILQNPLYKEAFGITWKFAVTHKDVRSVRTIKNKADAGADEYDAAKVDMLQKQAAVQRVRQPLNAPAQANKSFYQSFYMADGVQEHPLNAQTQQPTEDTPLPALSTHSQTQAQTRTQRVKESEGSGQRERERERERARQTNTTPSHSNPHSGRNTPTNLRQPQAKQYEMARREDVRSNNI